MKKLRQGDACWATRKVVLGWEMDTVAGTLCLPPHRIDRLYALLDAFPPTRKRVPASAWHRLLGENHSMTPALPGARGLFSILQDTLRQRSNNRLRLTRQVFDCLADFRLIADSLRNRPTRLRELVPVGAPYALGACDACLRGMGGVWFLPHQGPVVWRAAFPPAIQRALATSANRLGTLSISDLELAGTLAHKHALVQLDPTSVAERIIWLAGDNRASLSWATKGSATARSARACLLRLNALPQRCYRYVPHHDFIAGKSNVMADDASRRWDLSDRALLTHFNTLLYPQATSWRLLHLEPDMLSAVTGALSKRRYVPATLRIVLQQPPPPPGSGSVFALPTASAPTCATFPVIPSWSCSSLLTNIVRDASHPATDRCALEQWRKPSVKWRRRSPGWGPWTLA